MNVIGCRIFIPPGNLCCCEIEVVGQRWRSGRFRRSGHHFLGASNGRAAAAWRQLTSRWYGVQAAALGDILPVEAARPLEGCLTGFEAKPFGQLSAVVSTVRLAQCGTGNGCIMRYFIISLAFQPVSPGSCFGY